MYIYICMYIYIYVCMYIYMYMYIYVYVYMYIYNTYIHIEYIFVYTIIHVSYAFVKLYSEDIRVNSCPASRIGQVSLQRKGFLSIAQSIAQHRGLSLGPTNRVVDISPWSKNPVHFLRVEFLLPKHLKRGLPFMVSHSTLLAESKSTNIVQKNRCGYPRWWELNRWIHLECFWA